MKHFVGGDLTYYSASDYCPVGSSCTPGAPEFGNTGPGTALIENGYCVCAIDGNYNSYIPPSDIC